MNTPANTSSSKTFVGSSPSKTQNNSPVKSSSKPTFRFGEEPKPSLPAKTSHSPTKKAAAPLPNGVALTPSKKNLSTDVAMRNSLNQESNGPQQTSSPQLSPKKLNGKLSGRQTFI